MKAAKQMLLQWEKGDEEVLELWKKMNGWVYEGFDETYHTIGSDFDKMYYESNTYLLVAQCCARTLSIAKQPSES